MTSVSSKIKQNVLDIVFPKSCVGCGKADTYLCEGCRSKIILIKSPVCVGCGKLSDRGKFCPICRKKTELTGIVIAAHYEDGPLKEAIHTFKYDLVHDLKEDLSTFLVNALKQYGMTSNYVIVPVPLHRKRENWRGFNQSELLAKEVADSTDLAYEDGLLRRVKKTKVQIELKRKERLNNMLDAFQANAKSMNIVRGKRIILVDDVITTGATLNECAKALKTLKVKEVWGLVLGKH